MIQKTLTATSDRDGQGRYKEMFFTGALARSEKRFSHHMQRHNKMLYDAVAENLKDGEVVLCPLGTVRHDRPWGISFLFEKEPFTAIFPEPRNRLTPGDEPRILFCSKNHVSSEHMLRAAHHFDELFNSEYQRFFSHALAKAEAAK